MNNLNYEILGGIDAIADAELSAGISVMESIIHTYEKADMILENASDHADLSSYEIFQESTLFQEEAEPNDSATEESDKESNFRKINKKTGKKENILKSILLAIPRAIKMFCNWLKKKFTKNKVDANNKAMDNVAKAASSGEIAEKAPSIFEELAKLPAEKMLEKAKQNANASSSAKKAASPGMDTINPPKTELKANDTKTKKSNATMDAVGGNDTAASIEKQYLADPDHDSKLAEYQLKYLAATGKAIFDYDLNAIDDIMNAITKFSEDSEQMIGNMPDDDAGALAVFKKHLSIITKMNNKLDTLELKSNKVYPVDLPRIQKFYKENVARFGKTSAALTELQMFMPSVAENCELALTHGHAELDQNSIQIMYDHAKKLTACITKISSTCQFIWAKFDTLCSSIRELDNAIKRVTHKMSKLTNKRHEMIDKANSYVQDPTSEDAKKASDYVAKYVDIKMKGQQFADDNRNLPRDQYLAKARKELPEAFNSGTTTESYQESESDVICEGFFDLFKSKSKDNTNKSKNDVFIDKVLDEIEKETTCKTVSFEHSVVDNVTCEDSYCGGKPTYLPKNFKVREDLYFLAQINCKQLSILPNFPHSGILQFWINMNEYGEFGKYCFYYPNTSNGKSQQEIDKFCNDHDTERNDDSLPIEDGRIIKLIPTESTDHIPVSDENFDEVFIKKYNDLAESEEGITKIEDKYIPNDILDKIYKTPFGKHISSTQCGGYPYFTQNDPRGSSKSDKYPAALLFQLDSGNGVMWGDSGIGNFFISEYNLKSGKFDSVLFNWDCY